MKLLGEVALLWDLSQEIADEHGWLMTFAAMPIYIPTAIVISDGIKRWNEAAKEL